MRPFILRMQGIARVEPAAVAMRADFDWDKPDARREYLRVKLNAAGGLDLFANQSSAVLASAVTYLCPEHAAGVEEFVAELNLTPDT